MAMIRYLDPRNDLAFKKIFGTEKNKDILIGFLNDVLNKRGEDEILDVLFLNSTQLPLISEKKQNIIDVLCTDEKGIQYIVEMQVAKVGGFDKRALFYLAKTYACQLQGGQGYSALKDVIFLAIVDFIMFPEEACKSTHQLLNIVSYLRHLKDFSFTFVELPKFNKPIEELTTREDKWYYFFKHTNEPENMDKLVENSPLVKKAYHELSAHNWTHDELVAYEAIAKIDRDALARESLIKEESFEEGKKEGALVIAKNLLAKGLPAETIIEVTGLSREEIELLVKK
jgi:predicted transposase/invertase (TIGR01784 family)